MTVSSIPTPNGTTHGSMTTRERARNPNPPWQREKATDRAADCGTRKRKEPISQKRETEMEIERRSQRRGIQKMKKKRKKQIYWMKSK